MDRIFEDIANPKDAKYMKDTFIEPIKKSEATRTRFSQ